MSADRPTGSIRLVRSVLADEPRAWEIFVRKVADVVWTSCTILCNGDDEAQMAFVEVFDALKADDFRCLRRFNSSGTIQTFIALTAREILADRLMRLFSNGQQAKAWIAFERFFKADIHRI
jgi:RNA polymerase primary sigma factor